MLTLFNEYSGMFLEGFKFTIYSSLIALFFSLLIGTMMAILQLAKSKIIRGLARAYVEFFRNIPLLIIAMFSLLSYRCTAQILMGSKLGRLD